MLCPFRGRKRRCIGVLGMDMVRIGERVNVVKEAFPFGTGIRWVCSEKNRVSRQKAKHVLNIMAHWEKARVISTCSKAPVALLVSKCVLSISNCQLSSTVSG